jgi:tetratricopeptide (TPR) repeat protein
MPESRLHQLEQYYNEDPHDPFNVYALALEHQKHDPPKARDFFEKLLSEHPKYLPTYYHAAKLYHDLQQTPEALRVYEKGMKVAREAQDFKALRELQSAYDELTYE